MSTPRVFIPFELEADQSTTMAAGLNTFLTESASLGLRRRVVPTLVVFPKVEHAPYWQFHLAFHECTCLGEEPRWKGSENVAALSSHLRYTF